MCLTWRVTIHVSSLFDHERNDLSRVLWWPERAADVRMRARDRFCRCCAYTKVVDHAMKRMIQGCSQPVLEECEEASTGHGCQVPEITLVCTQFVLSSPDDEREISVKCLFTTRDSLEKGMFLEDRTTSVYRASLLR